MNKIKQKIFKVSLYLILGFLVITILPVLLYRVVDPPATPLMWVRWIESGYQKEYPLSLDRWVELKNISPLFLKAVIAAEDQKFFQHSGFDWRAVDKAVKKNLKSNKKIVGASTISMQTARNVFLWQSRSWLRKGLEAYFTFLIELFWPKERILEVYLNVIEWGDGTFGCESASRKYFKDTARTVSRKESAWLAAILPNPRQWSKTKAAGTVKIRQEKILIAMGKVYLPRNTFKP